MLRASITVLVVLLSVCLWARPQPVLADRLIAAASDEERARLLDDAGAAVDTALLAALQKRADAEFAAYRFTAAQPMYSAVLAVAERLHDASSEAGASVGASHAQGRTRRRLSASGDRSKSRPPPNSTPFRR
jgi:hypothetical protein